MSIPFALQVPVVKPIIERNILELLEKEKPGNFPGLVGLEVERRYFRTFGWDRLKTDLFKLKAFGVL
jgi:hypothetical protein